MERYKDLNKKEILSRWYEYVDLLEREWTMTPDGDIIKIPNDEIAKAYCKVLLGIYKQIEPFADEIKRDYEAIKDKNLHDIQANVDWDFFRVGAGLPDIYRESKSLIDAFHLEDSEAPTVDNIIIPTEYKSDFVFLFGNNEHVAKSFLKSLYESKKNGQVKPNDVAFTYRKYHGKPTEEGGNYQVLYDVIGKNGLGLYLRSYPSLTRAFRVKK